MNKLKIGILGLGNMGGLFLDRINSLNDKEILIYAFDKNTNIANNSDSNVIYVNSENELIKNSNIIFLAIKPKDYEQVLVKIKSLNNKSIIVNMTIGFSINDMVKILDNENAKIIRIMPNISIEKGCGLIGWCHININDSIIETFQYLLKKFGKLIPVSENQIDIFSVISSSLPAFIFNMIESISDGAVYCGMKRDFSYKLIKEVLLTTSIFLSNSTSHVASLKDKITSPFGSTIEGIFNLEKTNFRYSLMNSIIETFKKIQKK